MGALLTTYVPADTWCNKLIIVYIYWACPSCLLISPYRAVPLEALSLLQPMSLVFSGHEVSIWFNAKPTKVCPTQLRTRWRKRIEEELKEYLRDWELHKSHSAIVWRKYTVIDSSTTTECFFFFLTNYNQRMLVFKRGY